MSIPQDNIAEAVVAASSVGHPAAYRLAVTALTAEHFYSPRLGRLFDACMNLPWWDPCGVSARTARLAAVATIVDEDLAELQTWVDRHASFINSGAPWVRRVGEASRRRQAMQAALEVFNGIGGGEDLDHVRQWLDRLADLRETRPEGASGSDTTAAVLLAVA